MMLREVQAKHSIQMNTWEDFEENGNVIIYYLLNLFNIELVSVRKY